MSFFRKKNKEETAFFTPEITVSKPENSVHSPFVLTPEEILNSNTRKSVDHSKTSALDSLKQKVASSAPEKAETNAHKLSDKCTPYFLDEEGKNTTIDTEPIYKLQSVADILKAESGEAIKRLSEKYGIDFDEIQVEKEVFPKQVETPVLDKKKEPEKNISDTKTKIIISDIDTFPEEPTSINYTDSNSTTVTFTPITTNNESEKKITISTHTSSFKLGLTGEIAKTPAKEEVKAAENVKLEKNEFDEFVPKEEFIDTKTSQKLLRRLLVNKRSAFISLVVSVLITLLLSFAKLPFMTKLFLEHTMVSMIVCSALTLIAVIFNISVFKAIPKTFSSSSSPDVLAAFSIVFTLLYAVFSIIKSDYILDMLLSLSLILSIRAITEFLKASYIVSNLKVALKAKDIHTLKLINDPAITFSLAKDAIIGNALISVGQKTERISDYMKYTLYNKFLNGHLPIITVASLTLSLIAAFICTAYWKSVSVGFYAASAVQMLTCLPSLFFIDALPLFSTAKKLNPMGAMISGKYAAEQIEKANGTVIDSADIFPKGTVTLHQMKVLSENMLDDTLIRAAALTEYINSPLADLFKKITSTSNITVFPDTDTVKYEERMGISGWVDNRTLFIGNRTLMEAHGIDVPSVEIDRKILRQGYFPVYVASDDKICALLTVQYSVCPKTAKILRQLTKLGITLLVNNCDPNMTAEMISDYLGLYEDCVKVMSPAGSHMYKSTVSSQQSASAPAVFTKKPIAHSAILNCATKIKRSNILLSVIYIIAAVLGVVVFAYSSFANGIANESYILLFLIASSVISYLIYLFEKP